MPRAALLLLVLSAATALLGCGGDGAPLILPGDYFPDDLGDRWQYTVQASVETQSDTFETSGTMTREVVRESAITVAGSPVTAEVFAHTFALDDAPGSGFPLSPRLRAMVNLLFSAQDGGLRPCEAFYFGRPFAATPGVTAETLGGLAYAAGPLLQPSSLLPFATNSPVIGEAHRASLSLLPLPLAPPFDHVSDGNVTSRTLDYDDVGTNFGMRHGINVLESYAGTLQVGDATCPFNGQGSFLLQEGIGLAEADWTTVLNPGATWVRVVVRVVGQSFTSGE